LVLPLQIRLDRLHELIYRWSKAVISKEEYVQKKTQAASLAWKVSMISAIELSLLPNQQSHPTFAAFMDEADGSTTLHPSIHPSSNLGIMSEDFPMAIDVDIEGLRSRSTQEGTPVDIGAVCQEEEDVEDDALGEYDDSIRLTLLDTDFKDEHSATGLNPRISVTTPSSTSLSTPLSTHLSTPSGVQNLSR
jgi:hypothetical protein